MRWAFVLLLSGCGSILGIEDFQVGGDADQGGGFCLGPAGWEICLPAAPPSGMDVDIESPTTVNTADSSLCLSVVPKGWLDAGQPDACIVIGANITITNVLTARTLAAGRPLVLFAANTITISSLIDLSSDAGLAGAGTGPSKCANVTPPANNNGPGGGPGGSFMKKGGNGGAGTVGAAIAMAAPGDGTRPVVLRGGCAGTSGGDSGTKGGAGGRGGGAIYLVAGNKIEFKGGVINVSGAPGRGASVGVGGGGGGGSGGMIVLHAPAYGGIGGTVIANGGGGGGGAGSSSGLAGDGETPDPDRPGTNAQGGPGTGTGGRGGAGYATSAEAANGSNATVGANAGGGGGGGGGAGYIAGAPALVTASPASQPFP